MSWHYLQEQEAAFSVEHYLAGLQSARAKSSHTPATSSSTIKSSDSSPASPSGTTSAPSMAHPGAALSTSFPAASPVRTSQPQEKVPASPAPAQASGLKCTESFAKYNPATHSWKTHQCSLLADLDEFSETWPKSGIMLHGACWELPTAAPPHRRDRIWILAQNTDPDCPQLTGKGMPERPAQENPGPRHHGSLRTTRNPWAFEPRVGRVADGVAARVDRLKALGNGQVPLVAATAFQILKHRLDNIQP